MNYWLYKSHEHVEIKQQIESRALNWCHSFISKHHRHTHQRQSVERIVEHRIRIARINGFFRLHTTKKTSFDMFFFCFLKLSIRQFRSSTHVDIVCMCSCTDSSTNLFIFVYFGFIFLISIPMKLSLCVMKASKAICLSVLYVHSCLFVRNIQNFISKLPILNVKLPIPK